MLARLTLATHSALIRKELSFLDHLRDLRRHRVDPGVMAVADFGPDGARKDWQTAFIDASQALDKAICDQVGIQVAQMVGDAQVAGGDDGAGLGLAQWINTEFQVILKQPAERLD